MTVMSSEEYAATWCLIGLCGFLLAVVLGFAVYLKITDPDDRTARYLRRQLKDPCRRQSDECEGGGPTGPFGGPG